MPGKSFERCGSMRGSHDASAGMITPVVHQADVLVVVSGTVS